jgi:hypothetical protein
MRFKEIKDFARKRDIDREIHSPPNMAVPKITTRYLPVTEMKKAKRNGETMR